MSLSSNDNDSRELAKFGYKQDLKRSMKKFSSFAVSFSLISILTGIFANFHFGFSEVGSFIPFSWTIVFVGQFIVALIMAELSVNFPISGYGYQWTYRLVGPKLGFTTGWLLLLQFLTGFPGICKLSCTSDARHQGLGRPHRERLRWTGQNSDLDAEIQIHSPFSP